jgi:hypothetical protein
MAINIRAKKTQDDINLDSNKEAVATAYIKKRKPKAPVDPTKKKSLPLYLPPVLEAEIQADADADFITRNQWITDACKFYLKFKRDQAS